MLRRSVVAFPLLAAGAAALALVFAELGWLVVAGSALGGLLVAAALARVEEVRVRAVADRVARLGQGDAAGGLEITGSAQWQRLLAAVNGMGTSLQRRFDELSEARARVERLLDNLPIAVLLFDDAALAYANPAARELFDLDHRTGRTPMQVLSVQALADAVAETAETSRRVELEVERLDRHLVARTSATAGGEVALVLTDLTELRRVEALRRDFVTNASHELKTPVAGIQALSESLALALDRDPERARTMVERLHTEAERLGQLVRDLLDLSRVEEADGEGGRQRVDLAQLVTVQLDRLQRLARKRGVKLHADCPGPLMVVASQADLRLVVANLLENAVQYNRPGGEVRATVRPSGSDVVLEVQDTGVGIPEADLDRIFERFYRVDKARSRLAGGTGLGLAIVRHAVRRHGGTIEVDSILGEGSTFRVRLPVADA